MTSAKDPNPKDAAAAESGRARMGLFPTTAVVAGSMAFLEGDLKYGAYNWRRTGVRASVYHDALQRHIGAWWNGDDTDVDSGLPHLWKALACLAIAIDAAECGVLTDDRPTAAPLSTMLKKAEGQSAAIRSKLRRP